MEFSIKFDEVKHGPESEFWQEIFNILIRSWDFASWFKRLDSLQEMQRPILF